MLGCGGVEQGNGEKKRVRKGKREQLASANRSKTSKFIAIQQQLP